MSRGRDFYDAEWTCLQNWLSSLKDAGIDAVVLRNYDNLPARVGNDLDVFIRRSDLKKAEKALIEQVGLSGGKMVKKFRKDSFTAWWMKIGDAPLLHIDLFNGAFYWRGRLLETDNQIITHMRSHTLGFNIPSPYHQAFSMFVTSLIWGGFYQERYAKTLGKLLSDESEKVRFDGLIQKNFGDAGAPPFTFEDRPTRKCVNKYVQACMRARRAGECEPSRQEFDAMMANRPFWTRLNSWRKTYAKGLYRGAGFAGAERKIFRTAWMLGFAFVLQAGYVIRRFKQQVLNR